MASEQERKEAFLKVWFDAPENIHWAHGMSNGVEKDISDTFDRAIAAWNTRPAPADLKARDRKRYKLIRKSLQNKGLLPAATDTGLETVEYQHYVGGDWYKTDLPEKRKEQGHKVRELVTRSQAEELLAAEIRRERDLAAKQLSEVVDRMSDDYLALKADNAAVSAALGALDNALAVIGGCGDGNCVVVRPKGQHTNGGCRCFQDRMKMQRFAFAVNQFRDVVARVCEASK